MDHAWFWPTIERLVDILRYPDIGNEFGCRKVSLETVREVFSMLLRHMTPEMPAPRIEPLGDGGLLVEFNEYWVDCSILAIPGAAITVQLLCQAGWCEQIGSDETLFPKAVELFERLRKEGPPDVPAKKPDDGGVIKTPASHRGRELSE
jgi:hypothetical protein